MSKTNETSLLQRDGIDYLKAKGLTYEITASETKFTDALPIKYGSPDFLVLYFNDDLVKKIAREEMDECILALEPRSRWQLMSILQFTLRSTHTTPRFHFRVWVKKTGCVHSFRREVLDQVLLESMYNASKVKKCHYCIKPTSRNDQTQCRKCPSIACATCYNKQRELCLKLNAKLKCAQCGFDEKIEEISLDKDGDIVVYYPGSDLVRVFCPRGEIDQSCILFTS